MYSMYKRLLKVTENRISQKKTSNYRNWSFNFKFEIGFYCFVFFITKIQLFLYNLYSNFVQFWHFHECNRYVVKCHERVEGNIFKIIQYLISSICVLFSLNLQKHCVGILHTLACNNSCVQAYVYIMYPCVYANIWTYVYTCISVRVMRDRIHLNKQNIHLHQLIRMIDVAFNE